MFFEVGPLWSMRLVSSHEGATIPGLNFAWFCGCDYFVFLWERGGGQGPLGHPTPSASGIDRHQSCSGEIPLILWGAPQGVPEAPLVGPPLQGWSNGGPSAPATPSTSTDGGGTLVNPSTSRGVRLWASHPRESIGGPATRVVIHWWSALGIAWYWLVVRGIAWSCLACIDWACLSGVGIDFSCLALADRAWHWSCLTLVGLARH